jgi:TolB-like protein/tRNA A-37 threonylcarbamoyl transferase component Bud32
MKAFQAKREAAGNDSSLERCAACGSLSLLDNGLCINCLLQTALEVPAGEDEALKDALTAINVADADWKLGNYHILEEIGRGGMGIIYRARQRHSRRIVALKRLLIYSADCHETLARFRREAEAAASLDHPNILPIYEVGESDGVPFFTMKFAVGGSVRTAGAVFRTDPRKAVAMLAKVARAVSYANSQGILHRDLKPGNILLDGKGEPLVSDFGLAKWLDSTTDLTRTLTVFGTPGYIAPEQAHSAAAALTPAADIYSLGAILFELLAGRIPFIGEHALSVIQQATENTAPKLRSLNKALDRDLETICARCLEREPSARYQTAAELADDLERWCDGRPIRARPVLPPVALWRWSRRNAPLALAAAGCICLAAAVIWLGLARWETQHREGNHVPTKLAGPHIPEKSLAVLPFENLSGNKSCDAFVDGIQEDVSKDLAKISDLKVISPASVRSYKAGLPRDLATIQRELGVKYLVEGSVLRAADRVRVNAELIDATTGAHRWAEHYDRDTANFFGIGGELTGAIAYQLHAHVTNLELAEIDRRPTTNLKAYDLYLKANSLSRDATLSNQRGQDLLESIRLFQEAVSLDPRFFDAYCRLAFACDQVYVIGFDHTTHRLAVAEKAVEAVIQLRPNAAETHLAIATHRYMGYLDHEGARTELALARKGLPNEAGLAALQGYIDRRQGRYDKAIDELLRSTDLNPRDLFVYQELAVTFLLQRQFREMAAVLDRALAIAPQHAATRILQASVAQQRLGDTKPMHDLIEAMVTADPRVGPQLADYWFRLGCFERDVNILEKAVAVMPSEGMAVDSPRFPRAWCEAVVAKMRGEVGIAHTKLIQARAEVAETVRQQPGFPLMLSVLGVIDANLGRKDLAIGEGKKAVELLPLSKDSINGFQAIRFLAIIYAWTGEIDLALEQLQLAASIPSDINYGNLLLEPAWDPLRADPRFDKILASLAPK